MRASVIGLAVLVLAGCGGHRTAAPRCTLRQAATPVPETGEHTVAFTSSCAFDATPNMQLLGLHGAPLAFAYVAEGGPKGTHTILLDKYRCDVRERDLSHTLEVGGARLDLGRSLLDWCPAEAPSSIVHVYLGTLRRTAATWHGVFRDVYYDGRLDRVWPCRALRAAVGHLPPDGGPTYSKLPALLEQAAADACADAIAGLPAGASRMAFLEAFGEPSSATTGCTIWRWAPAEGAVDGVRVCFRDGRATRVQTALSA